MGPTALPSDYPRFLRELKERIRVARVRAVLAVDREVIALYWDLGRRVVERQKLERWGSAAIQRLSKDLMREFPEMRGLSPSNIWRMRSFFRAWPGLGAILARPVRELGINQEFSVNSEIFARPGGDLGIIADLPWGHNITLLEALRTPEERLWYGRQAFEQGWSRDVLAIQIESRLHLRQGHALTNFKRTLPPAKSVLAQQTLKAEYALDFLRTTGSSEREIERGMVEQVQQFLLELGAGFAFVGRQYHLEVGGEDFYLDLLFYHLDLHCYVVIELKAGAFKPEHAGKMSFYLSAADDLLRRPMDGPTIGIILCRSRNRVVAEYALRDSSKPIGVSSYQLTRALPEGLAGRLPSAEELEKAGRRS